MIKERMLELLILSEVIPNVGNYNEELCTLEYNGRQYNDMKLEQRYRYLIEEFLEPYVIDSTSKER